ncbi:potassium-transporting ATPase subunit KdpC [Pseudomonas sp. PDM18]|uniref:potassium-transporting ATPase subunit KdpC n=1 Tax=unclassified Pseudomonas TaxID=196821 RepID=UPI00178723BD|nr:potassium-transporting ATPase subunit KdpC [Pseudomonas sp. PDM18]MBD9678918.1 potassium-transporting ATPase subunit KdpC [Pseudomonas sp. PDM18]
MLNQLRPAIASLVLLSAVTGVAYPLAVTGIAQVAFHDQANGSLVRDDQGNVRGSALIAQKFDGAQWFHSRPSAGDFATVSSSASNLAPGNPALVERIAKDAAAQQIGAQPVPLALVTTSGSGLDPQLPRAAALYQVPRIALERGVPAASLEKLVEANTERPLIGPAVVNVLALNMALASLPR